MAQSFRYEIEMKVPLGTRTGSLELCVQNGAVTGSLTLFMKTTGISAGTYHNGNVAFRGTMQTLADTLHYSAHGTIQKRLADLEFITDRGSYHVTGTAK